MENKVRQRTTKDDQGQAGQEYLKRAPWNDISTSNNKDNNIKIVISNMTLYDEEGRNEGGTYVVHKEIYSMDVVESTPSGRGERYEPWLWWKEWSWWHWRKKDKEPTSSFQVNLHHT